MDSRLVQNMLLYAKGYVRKHHHWPVVEYSFGVGKWFCTDCSSLEYTKEDFIHNTDCPVGTFLKFEEGL